MDADTRIDAALLGGVEDPQRAADGPGRPVEGGEDAGSDVLDLVAGEPSEVIGDELAVGGGDLSPGVVGDARGRVDDISDEERREVELRSRC